MKNWYTTLVVEIFVRVFLFIVFYITDDAVPYFRQIQPEEYWLYKFPTMPSYYPGYILWITVFSVPSGVILLLWLIRRDVHDAKQALLCASLSIFLTGSVTNCIKLGVGRPRPDFLARCFPDGVIRDDMNCTGGQEEVIQGYKSFPSGHSSFAFSSLGFVALYLAGKLHVFNRHGQGSALKLCLVIIPLLWATMIAVSRTADYHHHWQDVTVGSALGMTLAYICYRQYYPSVTRSVSHLPHISLPSEKELPPYSPLLPHTDSQPMDSMLKIV